MSRQVTVEVGKGGCVEMEFSGFDGETCFDEAEGLHKALKALGLWAVPLTVTPKTRAQIEQELGVEKPQGKKVPVG